METVFIVGYDMSILCVYSSRAKALQRLRQELVVDNNEKLLSSLEEQTFNYRIVINGNHCYWLQECDYDNSGIIGE